MTLAILLSAVLLTPVRPTPAAFFRLSEDKRVVPQAMSRGKDDTSIWPEASGIPGFDVDVSEIPDGVRDAALRMIHFLLKPKFTPEDVWKYTRFRRERKEDGTVRDTVYTRYRYRDEVIVQVAQDAMSYVLVIRPVTPVDAVRQTTRAWVRLQLERYVKHGKSLADANLQYWTQTPYGASAMYRGKGTRFSSTHGVAITSDGRVVRIRDLKRWTDGRVVMGGWDWFGDLSCDREAAAAARRRSPTPRPLDSGFARLPPEERVLEEGFLKNLGVWIVGPPRSRRMNLPTVDRPVDTIRSEVKRQVSTVVRALLLPRYVPRHLMSYARFIQSRLTFGTDRVVIRYRFHDEVTFQILLDGHSFQVMIRPPAPAGDSGHVPTRWARDAVVKYLIDGARVADVLLDHWQSLRYGWGSAGEFPYSDPVWGTGTRPHVSTDGRLLVISGWQNGSAVKIPGRYPWFRRDRQWRFCASAAVRPGKTPLRPAVSQVTPAEVGTKPAPAPLDIHTPTLPREVP